MQRTVITRGSGAKASAGSTVDVAYSVYNGSTGKELESSGYEGQGTIAIPMKPDAVLPGMLCAVEGLPVGSQTVLTGSATEVLGSGVDPSKVGLTAKDSVVFVMNVADILPEKATGTAQKPVAGMPKVTLAKSGKPTVTIPKSDPPAETTVAVLKKGTGEAVQDGDSVTVQYQGVNWRTGKVFDQSWGRAVATFSTSQVVKGFQQALVGQSVGSQVLVTIPPADGYGTKGQPSAGIKGTDTLVFVIDILKTER